MAPPAPPMTAPWVRLLPGRLSQPVMVAADIDPAMTVQISTRFSMIFLPPWKGNGPGPVPLVSPSLWREGTGCPRPPCRGRIAATPTERRGKIGQAGGVTVEPVLMVRLASLTRVNAGRDPGFFNTERDGEGFFTPCGSSVLALSGET